MRKIISLPLAALFWILLTSSSVDAAAPVQIALFNPVQSVDAFNDVKGLRLNLIYGQNYNVSGVDIGLVNKVENSQKGIQIGAYNNTFDAMGVQIGLYNKTFELRGLQVGIFNRTEWLEGLQIGLINIHKRGQRKFLPIINFYF